MHGGCSAYVFKSLNVNFALFSWSKYNYLMPGNQLQLLSQLQIKMPVIVYISGCALNLKYKYSFSCDFIQLFVSGSEVKTILLNLLTGLDEIVRNSTSSAVLHFG